MRSLLRISQGFILNIAGLLNAGAATSFSLFVFLFSFSFSQDTVTLSFSYVTSTATNGVILSNSTYDNCCSATISGTTLTVGQGYACVYAASQIRPVLQGSIVVSTAIGSISGFSSCDNGSCSWSNGGNGAITRTCTNGSLNGCAQGTEFGSCLVTITIPNVFLPPCFSTGSAAQVLLVAKQTECNSLGGEYSGAVVHKENGSYCVEGECNFYSSCPADIPVPPALKKSIAERNYENVPDEESSRNYGLQPKPFYDALGRRTEPRSEIRRHLFTPRNARYAIKEKDIDMENVLKRENITGQCCVNSFSVGLINSNSDASINNKFGIYVEFDATFHREEHSSGCNPFCCEFKQETKGAIFKNGEYKTETSCRINGQYIDLDSAVYVPDCYGRDCNYIDGMDSYNDSLGTYKATDFPRLNDVKEGDTLNMRMEFNSYIKDRCNTNEIKSMIPWGFQIQGVVPAFPDSLEVILLGDLSP